jgi:hypothetical protein
VCRTLPTRSQFEPGDPDQDERHPDRAHRARVTEREDRGAAGYQRERAVIGRVPEYGDDG